MLHEATISATCNAISDQDPCYLSSPEKFHGLRFTLPIFFISFPLFFVPNMLCKNNVDREECSQTVCVHSHIVKQHGCWSEITLQQLSCIVHLNYELFDFTYYRDSMNLAFRYFTSSTLTVRLTGLNQITVGR